MSRRRYSMKAAKISEPPHRHHQWTGGNRGGVGGEQYLEAQQRIERDVQQQARQHGRYRRRTFGMSVGQPGMQRREADLCAIAEKQEYESNIEKCRVEIRRALDQQRPDHAVLAFAHDRTCRHVDQDGAEQSERNTDAAQDKIFPGRFQCSVGANMPTISTVVSVATSTAPAQRPRHAGAAGQRRLQGAEGRRVSEEE